MEKAKIKEKLLEFNNILKESDDIYRNTTKTLGLSDSAFWILYTFRTVKEVLTLSEICNTLYVPKQTVHSALKKMKDDGYIRLEEETDDRRTKLITLTAEGKKIAEETADKVVALECRALLGMTEKEREDFVNLFRKYIDLLRINMLELHAR